MLDPLISSRQGIELVNTSFSGPWPAPAKLNLMLRIVGRRPDGYHELQTVYQLIDHCDLLFFRVRRDGRITREGGPRGLSQAEDLAVRAAVLLRQHIDCELGVDIRIDKRLPVGGGLGGGSSDAATTLLALNRLWEAGLSEDQLLRLGLYLGADVPVFIRGHAAWGEGVGERLQPLVIPQRWYLVLVPPCHVSTAAVFSADQLTRDSPRTTISKFLAGDAVNDCLPLVRKEYPPIARALNWLDRYGGGRLTGTGACVFAEFGSEMNVRDALHRVPAEFAAFVACGLNLSPVKKMLQADYTFP